MALLGKDIKKEFQKKTDQIVANPDDDSFTNKEKTVMELAKVVIFGVLLIIAGLTIGLFFLIVFGKDNGASLFKDITTTFIAVASGLLGSILGYYYKNNE